VEGELAALNDRTGLRWRERYVPGRASQAGQAVREKHTKRHKLVLQVCGFCGWAGNTSKENKVIRKELEISGIQDLRSKHKQIWIKHLERMDNTRLPKHALNYKPHIT
jgi:hypothetical protein